MAGQPTVVVQMREEPVRVGVDLDLAAVMKAVAITNHVCAPPGFGAAASAGVSSGFGVAAASGGPGAAFLPG